MKLDLYAHPVPVDLNLGRGRIYAQRAYGVVREISHVPVVHSEALELARWFPVVWFRPEGEAAQFVALRTLLPGGLGHPVGSPAMQASLPLLLKAYPLVLPPSGDSRLWVDAVIADQPTDAGAAILGKNGTPNAGTRYRLDALVQYQRGIAMTEAMSRMIEDLGLLVPWKLEFPDNPELGPFPHYFTLKQDALESDAFVPFARRFGLEALRLISAHTLSLFRAGILFRRAKQDLAQQKLDPSGLTRPSVHSMIEAGEAFGQGAETE